MEINELLKIIYKMDKDTRDRLIDLLYLKTYMEWLDENTK